MSTAPAASPEAGARAPFGIQRRIAIRAVVIAALLVFVLVPLPSLVGSDWLTTFSSTAIYAIVALGFGILYGRVGMISLGQVALLSVGVWIGARLAYGTGMPYPILLLATGALTTETPPVRRPSIAEGDVDFYRYIVIVAAIMFLLALIHVASKPGRAWASIRESEPAALAAGVNITFYKMWAFALASFMTGVAGCLFASQVGVPRVITFRTQDSLTLAATALIGGVFSLWGALVAAVFNQVLPFLFQAEWGIDTNFLLIIFGIGLLQVLLTAPGGLAQQFPRDMANLGRFVLRGIRSLRRPKGERP